MNVNTSCDHKSVNEKKCEWLIGGQRASVYDVGKVLMGTFRVNEVNCNGKRLVIL